MLHVKHLTGGTAPPASVHERLASYAALLRRWNATINLIGRADEAELERRHIEDSLQLIPLIPDGTRSALDLGSGAGFPGLVLAVATGIPFTLIEADQRKCAFLREAARVTDAPVDIQAVRMETVAARAPLVTARALASVSDLLPTLARLVAPGGAALLMKGRTAEDELTAVGPQWQMRVERHASRTRPGAAILKLTDIARRSD